MIKDLKINNLRNLSDIHLSLGAVNVVIGANGSGKTSLLESIYLLSRGKSFRHHEPKRYISHNADTCTVWAKFGDNSTLAIAKHKDGTTDLRHNQTPTKTQATHTRLLPVLLIDPSGMDILEDGSASRRQLLDFLCFHSTPNFHAIWLEYNRALKQRNALLKHPNAPFDGAIHAQIFAWDRILADNANALHTIRQSVFDAWQNSFDATISQLLPSYDGQISLAYHAGFDTEFGLQEILKDRLHSDIELGYTRIGVHRADLSIHAKSVLNNGKSHKEQAVNVLSRGQKKLLITALKLSGLPLITAQDSTPVVLIDDIDSELDDKACAVLLKTLVGLDCQIVVSSLGDSISQNLSTHFCHKAVTVFNIDNGIITPTAH